MIETKYGVEFYRRNRMANNEVLTRRPLWMKRNADECMIEKYIWYEKETLKEHIYYDWSENTDFEKATARSKRIAANRLIWC